MSGPSLAHPTMPAHPARPWDIIVSIALALGLLAATALVCMFALCLPMAADGCGTSCSTDQITVGFLLAIILPVLAALAAVVLTIVFLVKRRLAFWVPLAGLGAVVCGFLIGFAIVTSAIPNFF